ncbi:MAG TPA: hypothetical protein VF832_13430, partial [Longimicrobiales bacterium]
MSTTLSRRSFVKLMGGAGAGLLLGVRIERGWAAGLDGTAGAGAAGGGAPADWTPNAFLRIDPSGVVTI